MSRRHLNYIQSLVPAGKFGVGIDITADGIDLAVVQKNRNELRLTKALRIPAPPGSISEGNIKDHAAVTAAVRQACSRLRIRGGCAAVSLFARPTLSQVMNLPKQTPANISRYVRNEVKHCAILPNKNVAVDYCGISASKNAQSGRMFVVAAEKETVLHSSLAFAQIGPNLVAVEPAVLACARALHAKKIAKKFDCKVMIALVRDGQVEICIFRNQSLDFVRTRPVQAEKNNSESAADQIAAHINEILQFYEIEVSEDESPWEILVVADRPEKPAEQFQQNLAAAVSGAKLQVVTAANICSHTDITAACEQPTVSLAAVGLAMRALDIPGAKVNINLLPPEAARRSEVKKLLLVTANAAVAVVMVMILAAGLLSYRLRPAEGGHQNTPDAASAQTLVEQRDRLEKQTQQLSTELEQMQQVFGTDNPVPWARILEDIRQKTPRNLCINTLLGEAGSRLMIQGSALSYEAVHLFQEALARSSYVASAELIATEKSRTEKGLFTYSIQCSLNPESGT